MENKIDQFFKNKLQDHSLQPSAEAWSKVETGLSKKNNAIVWRIAAALLLTGALISVMIWSRQKPEGAAVIAKSKSPVTSPEKERPLASATEKKPQPMLKKHAAVSRKSAAAKNQAKEQMNMEPLPIEPISVQSEQETAMVKNNEQENKKEDATQTSVIASTKQKPIKLEFTLEEIPSESVATTHEQKSTGLKKVWELAREVKNGDGPMREIKNELFAFNFKKNKNQ